MYSAKPLRSTEPTRYEWCLMHGRAGTRLSALFHTGEQMRCPLPRRLASGKQVTCGGGLGEVPPHMDRAVVRGAVGLPPIVGGERRLRTCGDCRKPVDVFLIRKALALGATG